MSCALLLFACSGHFVECVSSLCRRCSSNSKPLFAVVCRSVVSTHQRPGILGLHVCLLFGPWATTAGGAASQGCQMPIVDQVQTDTVAWWSPGPGQSLCQVVNARTPLEGVLLVQSCRCCTFWLSTAAPAKPAAVHGL